jgi:hypothetical protein
MVFLAGSADSAADHSGSASRFWCSLDFGWAIGATAEQFASSNAL